MKREVAEILKTKREFRQDSLIPMLQEIQNKHGFLSEESVARVGKELGIPTSKIYGVATFYNQFRFEPKGKYHIQVCRGTACHVLGSATVLNQIEKKLKVKSGQTTRDRQFSISDQNDVSK
jgi:NADH:ubiquinone oxidoreductase subunit E